MVEQGTDASTDDPALAGANRQFTDDRDLADESVKKLAGLGAETILFGHGDPSEEGAARQLRALADSLRPVRSRPDRTVRYRGTRRR